MRPAAAPAARPTRRSFAAAASPRRGSACPAPRRRRPTRASRWASPTSRPCSASPSAWSTPSWTPAPATAPPWAFPPEGDAAATLDNAQQGEEQRFAVHQHRKRQQTSDGQERGNPPARRFDAARRGREAREIVLKLALQVEADGEVAQQRDELGLHQ